MKIVVLTQYKENYGTEENPVWKFKGGSEFVVGHMSAQEAALLGQAGLDAFAKAHIKKYDIEYSNPMSEEYVINWSLEDDSYKSQSEADQMEFDGRVSDPMKDFTKG